MSELAPLVATVLRDRAVLGLMAEMKNLKRLIDERLKVQITGRGGFPVYFEGSLKDGYTSHRGRCFEVMSNGGSNDNSSTKTTSNEDSSSRNSLTLSAFDGIEVRLGGIVIQRLGMHNVIGSCNAPFFTDNDFYRDTKYNKPIYLEQDRKEIILKVTRHNGPILFVIARFGREMSLEEYRRFHQLDVPDLKALRSRNNCTLILDGLTFSKRDIKQVLSVLDEMGYSVDKGNTHCHHADEFAKIKPRSQR